MFTPNCPPNIGNQGSRYLSILPFHINENIQYMAFLTDFFHSFSRFIHFQRCINTNLFVKNATGFLKRFPYISSTCSSLYILDTNLFQSILKWKVTNLLSCILNPAWKKQSLSLGRPKETNTEWYQRYDNILIIYASWTYLQNINSTEKGLDINNYFTRQPWTFPSAWLNCSCINSWI